MHRRVKIAKTRAIFVRKQASDANKILAPVKHVEHPSPAIPEPLEKVIRKPLQTSKTRKSRKVRHKIRNSEQKLANILSKKLAASHTWGKNGSIHPIAVLAWLAAEEPYNSQFLLENAAVLVEGPLEVEEDPILCAQIDGIIERFTEATITNAPSSQENPLVEIPKDFSMTMTPARAGGFEDHDAIMEDCDNKRNAMHRLVDAMDRKKPARYGFDPVQVLKKHAITFQESESPNSCNLTADIHPLFREENFHGCPQHIYEVLKPGLRLSTLLLTHRATASFWHTAIFGLREASLIPGIQRIRKDVPWSTKNSKRYNAYLTSLAESLHFHFSLWPTPKHEGTYLYGSLHPIKDYQLGWAPKPGEPCRKSRICLHTDFYTTAKRLSLLKSPDPNMVLRFNMFFAVNIAHELAHFLEMSGHHYHISDVYCSDNTVAEISHSKEPFINDQRFNEIGSAFETKIFGGRIHPISCRIDCAYGLTTFDESDNTNTAHVRTYYTIPMDYASKLQQQDTWDSYSPAKGTDGRHFHIPRNGAKAVSVPYFDMTVWENGEEEMIADRSDSGKTPFLRANDGRIVKVDLDVKTNH